MSKTSFASSVLATAGAFLLSADANSFAASVGASDPAPANTLIGKEMKYFFKTEKIKDADGKVIGDGRKHPDVVAVLPVPTVEDVINFVSHLNETGADGKKTAAAKVADLILEALQDVVFQAGRSQINDFLEKNPEGTFTATNFDLSKLSLEYIASLERGQRGAWAPSDEDLKLFNEDYTNVFVHQVNYDPKKVKVHCDQFDRAFSKIKSDKVALGKMQDFLTIWASKTSNMDTLLQTYEYLVGKIHKFLKAEEKNFADAL
jgi:hypothetical protein